MGDLKTIGSSLISLTDDDSTIILESALLLQAQQEGTQNCVCSWCWTWVLGDLERTTYVYITIYITQ